MPPPTPEQPRVVLAGSLFWFWFTSSPVCSCTWLSFSPPPTGPRRQHAARLRKRRLVWVGGFTLMSLERFDWDAKVSLIYCCYGMSSVRVLVLFCSISRHRAGQVGGTLAHRRAFLVGEVGLQVLRVLWMDLPSQLALPLLFPKGADSAGPTRRRRPWLASFRASAGAHSCSAFLCPAAPPAGQQRLSLLLFFREESVLEVRPAWTKLQPSVMSPVGC